MKNRLKNMISTDTQKTQRCFLITALVSFVVAPTIYNTTLFATVVLILFAFIIFITNPELPLAILFNGTLIYFYVVYKLGFQTNRVLTGAFYGFIVYSFLLAEVLLLSKKHISFRFSLVDMLFFVFFILFFLSYLAFSTGNDNAYKKITYAPLLAIMPYCGGRLLLSEKRVKNFFKYAALIAVVLMVPAFYEFLFNPLLTQRARFSMYFLENAANKVNPILFGGTYATLLIIMFVWMFERGRFTLRNVILIGLSAYLILLSGSRGVVVSLAAAITFYLFVLSKMKRETKLFAVFSLLFLFLVSYTFLPSKLKAFYQYSVSSAASQDATSSIQIRTSKWEQAICDFAENPIIGVGTGNSDNRSGYPHNILLEVAAEYGIIGFFIFTVLCYTIVRKGVIFIKKEDMSNSHILMKLLFVLFVYFLVHAMFSGHIAKYSPLYITMGLIGSLENLRRDFLSRKEFSPCCTATAK